MTTITINMEELEPKKCKHKCKIQDNVVVKDGKEIAELFWNDLTDMEKLHFGVFRADKRREILKIIEAIRINAEIAKKKNSEETMRHLSGQVPN